jgi:hypothetical protein
MEWGEQSQGEMRVEEEGFHSSFFDYLVLSKRIVYRKLKSGKKKSGIDRLDSLHPVCCAMPIHGN